MTDIEAQAATGLIAREIAHPTSIPRDSFYSEIGDLFRCQLGRVIPQVVKYTETTPSGRTIDRTIKTSVFDLVACGATFDIAVNNAKASRK